VLHLKAVRNKALWGLTVTQVEGRKAEYQLTELISNGTVTRVSCLKEEVLQTNRNRVSNPGSIPKNTAYDIIS
jgi:hypothetical protein